MDSAKHPADEEEGPVKPVGFFQSDLYQQIMMTINTAIAIYSACMAALLALFVPQICCPDVSFGLVFHQLQAPVFCRIITNFPRGLHHPIPLMEQQNAGTQHPE